MARPYMKSKMTKNEAERMLEEAPHADIPSAINPNLTQRQTVDIIAVWILSPECESLSELDEKRVWQAFKNQRRPKY